MYTLIRNVQSRDGLLVEAPVGVGALVVAETCYKFQSFTLECVRFLALNSPPITSPAPAPRPV
jgi:hypothetical protein